MTLYLKYRPKNLDELDEIAVAESLKKIVSKKKIPHAFLFAGPKGTGKTSAARILAKVINCESLGMDSKNIKPCERCGQCKSISGGSNLDVVEMDAASHRGIDDVRVLRDAVKLSPVLARKKIYIIDEVHMLTTEAGNALLKTLEEPPEHVIFILATTNPEKLIETIRSRATLIQFKKAEDAEILRSLKRVTEGEKIEIGEESLKLIAGASDGSFRDAIKILEQIVAEERELTKDSLEEFLFRNKSFDLNNFIGLLVEKNLSDMLREVENFTSKGNSADFFLESLIKKLRNLLLSSVGVGDGDFRELSKDELIHLIELLQDAFFAISSSPVAELPLELALMKWCGEKNNGGDEGVLHPETLNDNDSAQKVDSESFSKDFVFDDEMGVKEGVWKDILEMVKPVNVTMEALLRAAKPMFYDGKSLTLGVYYKFHKERIEEVKHREILEQIAGKVFHSPVRVCCILVDPPSKKITGSSSGPDTVLTEGKDQNIIEAAEKIFSN